MFTLLLIQIALLVFLLVFIAYMVMVSYLVYRGSNYIATPQQDIDQALSVLKKGDVFIDLGFGRGEVLQAAAQKDASAAIGYELDFIRFFRTWWKLRNDGYQQHCLRYADIWSADLSRADVVFTFFTIRHMPKLYQKAKKEMKKGSWFISYVHEVPNVKPTKHIGKLRFFKM